MIVAITTPLSAELVERVVRVGDGVEVRYEPDLLPPPRYASDHRGDPEFRRTTAGQRRWQEMLGAAHVFFGIPGDDPEQLAEAVDGGSPHLRFVQATAAGAGEQVAAAGLSAQQLERVIVASASGVHAGPLGEFALFGLLAFARGLPRLRRDQAERRWDHYPTRELAGRTVAVLGTGAIGTRIAQLCRALSMIVVGVNSTGHTADEAFDQVVGTTALPELAPRADALVITLPATAETVGLVDATLLAALPSGAILVNVGRGRVIDEEALVAALQNGRLAGAALDVTAREPLPPTSALWTMPTVLLSPHTAALSPRENERIVDLFVDNLHRLLEGREVRNRITARRRY